MLMFLGRFARWSNDRRLTNCIVTLIAYRLASVKQASIPNLDHVPAGCLRRYHEFWQPRSMPEVGSASDLTGSGFRSLGCPLDVCRCFRVARFEHFATRGRSVVGSAGSLVRKTW